MIPKRIFYVWGANESKPEKVLKCIESWKKSLPDYEIIEINDESKEYFDFQEELKQNKWFKTVYERKMWAYVADYVRVKVLYDNGGIYLDTDVEVLKDMSPLLNNPAFVGLQSEKLTEPAILGAQQGNMFIKKISDFYNREIWNTELYTLPQIFSRFIAEEYRILPESGKFNEIVNLKHLTIYPQEYLVPFQSGSYTSNAITSKTYTIHWFNGSWVKPEILYFLENKHKMNTQEIDESFKSNGLKYRAICRFREKKLETIKCYYSMKNKEKIPIFLSSDNNYAPFAATTIASICDNTKSFCDFYILDDGISDENKEKICKLKKQFDNFTVEFIQIKTDKYFKNFITESYITMATYYRLIIADLFTHLNKVLYIDVDIIAKGDISELYKTDLGESILGAVRDQGDKQYIDKLKENIEMDDSSSYFNAGVLLINLKKWREQNITQKLFEIEKKYHGKLLCNDQDILNKFFENNYKELPVCFNSMLTAKNAIIRHFYSRIKPWHVLESLCVNEYEEFRLFWHYAKLCEITDLIDCKYKTKHSLQVLKLYKKKSEKEALKPKVSVIIPVYNTEAYLRKCLDSVCDQTLRDIEIICINDCSPDNCLEILKEYQNNDNRIKIIDFKENRGVATTRNEGIKIAKGEYIGFVDSDDWINLDFYEKLYDKAIENNSECAKGTMNFICNSFNFLSNSNELIKENHIYFTSEFTTAIYKTQFVIHNQIYFPNNISHLEDFIWCVNIAQKINNICFENDAIYNYIRHGNGASHNINFKSLSDLFYSGQFVFNSINNKTDFQLLLKSLIINYIFPIYHKLNDNNLKNYMQKEIKKSLNLKPEYNLSLDFQVLYKDWLKKRIELMNHQIRTRIKSK